MSIAESFHIIGIGGVGMSALAHLLLDMKFSVSGSDLIENGYTQALKARGARIYEGHDASHLMGSPVVIYSTGIPEDNPEFVQAKKLSCKLLHRSQLLAQLTQDSQVYAVSGSHGKSSTSAMLATCFEACGESPSFAVGAQLKNFRRNAKVGTGNIFVIEADESDGSFLKSGHYGAIITNLEAEHLNYWKTQERLERAFRSFAESTPPDGPLLWCYDDPGLRALGIERGYSYGFSRQADFQILNWKQEGFSQSFEIKMRAGEPLKVSLPLLGAHQALNATACLALMSFSGCDLKRAAQGLTTYGGISRRLEKIGEKGDILFYDDYAHHPTEVKVTLEAVKAACPDRRLVVVFQPHRYTRLEQCFERFVDSFAAADQLFLTPVYAAGESPIVGFESQDLLEALKKKRAPSSVSLVELENSAELASFLKPQDLFLTMGAGSVTYLGPEVYSRCREPALH